LRVQNAAQGILNRVWFSWARRRRTEACVENDGKHFGATSFMFHFVLLLTITVLFLCCLSLCCFLNQLQALFYHYFRNYIKNS
jgi:hypothetical protein